MEGNNEQGVEQDSSSIKVISDCEDLIIVDLEKATFTLSRKSFTRSFTDSTDFQELSIHSNLTTFVQEDGQQFFERRNFNVDELPYSAELHMNNKTWKLNREDCLLTLDKSFVAKVSVKGSISLEDANSFEEAARILLKHVKMVKVLMDEQLEEFDKAKKALQMILDQLVGDPKKVMDPKSDTIVMQTLLQKHGHLLNNSLMDDVWNFPKLSSETTAALEDFVKKALKLMQRNEILGHLNESSISDDFINDAIQKASTTHRARLEAICPLIFLDELRGLPEDSILYVSMNDMELFADLTKINQPLLQSTLPTLFSKFLTIAQNMNEKSIVDLNPLSSPIFLFICKELLEIAEQFEADTENYSVLIYDEERGWQISKGADQNQTSHSKQLQMMVALANHFEPGGPFRTNSFPYELELFQNQDEISDPVRVWLCLLDDCMKDLAHADSDKIHMLQTLLQRLVTYKELQGETLACLRKIANGTLQTWDHWRAKPQKFDRKPSTVDDSRATCSSDFGKALKLPSRDAMKCAIILSAGVCFFSVFVWLFLHKN